MSEYNLNILANDYDSYFNDKSVWQVYFNVALKNILPFINGNNLNICDVGCGTGKWSLEVAQITKELTIIDISNEMLQIAKNKIKEKFPDKNVNVYNEDICNMESIKDNTYDYVLCMGDPLSYCENYNDGIKELLRICKIGGKVIVSVDYLRGYFRVFKKKNIYEVNEILNFINSGDIIGLEGVKIHAFTVDELNKYFNINGGKLINSWVIPKVISNFDENEEFLSKLTDINYFDKIVNFEYLLSNSEFESIGPSHLYSVFEKVK
ncbi:MAG: class I SAM-dependent methyltransferase [Clostridium sp.]|uniref:class I SAM-dependent methyltransferase n=1 Tax=Clostridium sp. TaxID=1506 RepID=UPI003EE63F1F